MWCLLAASVEPFVTTHTSTTMINEIAGKALLGDRSLFRQINELH